MIRNILFVLLLASTSFYTQAQIRYVRSTATGANDGSSWANAFTTLQPAIDAAFAGGGDVWVAAGTYKPTTTTNRALSFVLKNNVSIYGGFNGTETQLTQRSLLLNATFLSGEIGTTALTDNSYHVVTADATVTAGLLDGFRITKGYTDNTDTGGGGFYSTGASVIVRNCQIFQNQVSLTKRGAGVYLSGGGSSQFINCQIYANIAPTGNGGGVFVLPPASATIINSLFYSNEAANGGALGSNGSANIINCTFSKNKATNTSAGAIYVGGGASGVVTVSNSILWGNLSATVGREEIFAEFGGTFSASSTNNIIPSIFSLGVNAINANPNFYNASGFNNDYRVRLACAPGVNAGSLSVLPGNITTDLDGNARQKYDALDIGAYEFNDFSVNKSGVIAADCFGANTAITFSSNGLSMLSYEVGSFASTSNTIAVPPATYQLRLIQTGCTTPLKIADITITEPLELLFPTPTTVNASCNNISDASITLSASGGTAPYEFEITSNNLGVQTNLTGSFSNLRDDVYACKVTDAKGCVKNQDVTITEPQRLTVASVVTPVDCFERNTGLVDVVASGGTEPYSFSKDGTNFFAEGIFSALSAGTYTLYVEDINHCLASETVVVTEPDVLEILSVPQFNVTCFGANDGQLEVNANGGSQPYLYSIDNANYVSDFVFTGLASQNYRVYVKDANACEAIPFEVVITQPSVLKHTVTATAVDCFGNSNGQLELNATGGAGSYGYSKDGNNFVNTNLFNFLSGGDYPTQVIDLNGCLSTQEVVTIAEPAMLAHSATFTNLTCFGQNNGSITVAGSGGTLPYEWSIDGVNFTSNSNTFSNLTSGTYKTVIRDANNCKTSVQSGQLTEPALLTIGAEIVNGFEIQVTGKGGTSPYQFSIDGTAFQNGNIFSGLINGQYTLTVKDSRACVAVTQTDILITSLDEAHKLVVYPNPFTESVSLGGLSGDELISLINTSGTSVLQLHAVKGDNVFDLSNMNSGFYLLKIDNLRTGKKNVVKVIKN